LGQGALKDADVYGKTQQREKGKKKAMTARPARDG
jgi:hypothetical protein